MTNNDLNNKMLRVEELVQEKCNGSLTAVGVEELQSLLAESPEIRSLYWDMMAIHSHLEWDLAGKTKADKELQTLLPVGPEKKALASDPASNPRSASRWLGPVLAAGLLFALASLLTSWKSAESLPLADQSKTEQHSNEQPSAIPDANELPYLDVQLSSLSEGSRWHLSSLDELNPSKIRQNQTVSVEVGSVAMNFDGGTIGHLKAPVELQLLTQSRVRLLRGKIKVEVSEGAEGFIVETPSAEVIDLGTVFSVEAAETGTGLVVFGGKVDLRIPKTDGPSQGPPSTMRFTTGQAVHVDLNGTVSRIMNVQASEFDLHSNSDTSPVITSVEDNIVRNDYWTFYEIVQRGMAEDARTFVDRFHEWNGITPEGMPSYLEGGDYVKMFNDDKVTKDFQLKVALAQPATLYVLLDDRVTPPDWIKKSFIDTGDHIGVDETPYDTSVRFPYNDKFAQVGPGISIDRTHSIWKTVVPKGGIVTLGQNGQLPSHKRRNNIRAHTNMYGIVAVPFTNNAPSQN